MPPSASANAPSLVESAPVNAPRSCPKNSLPERVGTIVVQSSTTRSRFCVRASSAWMSRAASSFPVPLSPVMRTGESVNRAISTIRRTTDRQARLSPTSRSRTSGSAVRSSTCCQRLRRAATVAGPCDGSQTKTSLAPASSNRQSAPSASPVGTALTAITHSSPPLLHSCTRRERPVETSSNRMTPAPLGGVAPAFNPWARSAPMTSSLIAPADGPKEATHKGTSAEATA